MIDVNYLLYKYGKHLKPLTLIFIKKIINTMKCIYHKGHFELCLSETKKKRNEIQFYLIIVVRQSIFSINIKFLDPTNMKMILFTLTLTKLSFIRSFVIHTFLM